ncbi:BREX system P-loop protein BrxC [Agromyces arachidis]|uniref:BREX system P-loop protein BrxC n=1 Tax=Agromyces arachidis TaxID=766966 RepID=UPI004057C0BA
MPEQLKLAELFVKDIARPIDGVIRASDASHLRTEIDEYVLTNEIEKYLSKVLEAYIDYQTANGVWISGFFGSGKSHMLKMLSHLLGDVARQEFPRAEVATSFETKTDDAFLRGLIAKSAKIPGTSLLFNIAEEATNKDQGDVILRAFARVFNEARGYEGKQPYVARFERDLDREGKLEAFKEAFQARANAKWEDRRDAGVFAEMWAAPAFAEVTGAGDDAPKNILASYRETYSLSVGDFAEEVLDWLNAQESTQHRLAFFVDEIGQFIGSNVGLMLELQTIAEALNTTCQGRAWVFVTSQEDMEKVVGDRTREQSQDFSKIRDRFKTRVNLTSHDVEEVIRKRLLLKTTVAADALEVLFEEEHANFKTFFEFGDNAKTFRNYPNVESFVGTYPFVNFQFGMFHLAMIGLSEHNAFEGRNAAVGERSMLAAVQQVAMRFGDRQVGSLAPFDSFYDGLEADIKAAAKGQIEIARRNLGDDFAVRVLKALFLVKYVEGFKEHTTVRNIGILLFDDFEQNIAKLHLDIKAALDLLEAQTYIQRNGDVYSYLTNDEQVMEGEIKNVPVDSSEVSRKLHELLSGDVMRPTKITYKKTGQDFAFGWMIDDQVHGAQRSLTIHVITPNNPHAESDLRLQSAGRDELRVILAADDRLLPDLTLLLKTDKYVKQKNTPSLSAAEQSILLSKRAMNDARRKELIERLRRAVGAATLIVNAQDVASSTQDAQGKLDEGLQALVGKVYPSLNLLGGVVFSESDVASYARGDGETLDAAIEYTKLKPVTDEVFNRVALVARQGGQATVKTLVDHFEAKPYGWPLAATLSGLARLIATAELTASVDGNVVKQPDLASTLRNTARQAQTVVKVTEVIDPAKVQRLRRFCTDYFNEPTTLADPGELARHVRDRLVGERDLVVALRGTAYPFASELDEPLQLLNRAAGQTEDWFFDGFVEVADLLLEAKESVIAPVQSFLAGDQKAIFDEAQALLDRQIGNIAFVDDDQVNPVREALADPGIFRGAKTAKLKQAANLLRSAIEDAVDQEREREMGVIDERIAQVRASAQFQAADDDTQERAIRVLEVARAPLEAVQFVAEIRQLGDRFEEKALPEAFDLLNVTDEVVTVSLGSIDIPKNVVVIDSELALDRYLADVRAAIFAALEDGKQVTL